MVISHAYAVFDTNANAAEVGGPSLVVGDVNTTTAISLRYHIADQGNERFNGDTIAGLQVISSGIAGAVMHIKADVMTQMVWEQGRNCLVTVSRKSQSLETISHVSRKIKTKLFQLVLQPVFCNSMQFVKGKFRAFAAERKTCPMHIEDSVVQIPLRICEFAVDWPSSCDIGDVATKLLLQG